MKTSAATWGEEGRAPCPSNMILRICGPVVLLSQSDMLKEVQDIIKRIIMQK